MLVMAWQRLQWLVNVFEEVGSVLGWIGFGSAFVDLQFWLLAFSGLKARISRSVLGLLRQVTTRACLPHLLCEAKKLSID